MTADLKRVHHVGGRKFQNHSVYVLPTQDFSELLQSLSLLIYKMGLLAADSHRAPSSLLTLVCVC